MTEPGYPAFIPGRAAPKRRMHPAVWAVLGAVVALLAAGGAYLALKPGDAKAPAADPDRARAIQLCEDSVRGQLRSPSSAKFSGETYAVAAVWTVTGNVDAQNGFGAMLRDTWDCTLFKSGGSLTVIQANIHDNN